jgi:sterol desaturase/sphingolipid hydroxylase (fatty acid hydroxylase superfamily)
LEAAEEARLMDIVSRLQPHLSAFARDLLRLCMWLLILMIVFVPLERLCALHPQKVFRKAFLTDVAYCFLSGLLPKLLLVAPMAIVAWVVHSLVPGELHSRVAALPFWIRFPAAMMVGEIGFYWGHRWTHEIPFLWRFHAIHHSAEEMDWLVNSRAHPMDMVFTRLCGLIPLYVLGLAQPAAKTVDLVSLLVVFTGTLWGFFIHANLKWRFGPLGWLVATPAFHHWHHTYEEPRNKNYAPMLPWIDVMFGTYYMPRTEWPSRYGIDSPVPSALVAQVLEPLMPPFRRSDHLPSSGALADSL